MSDDVFEQALVEANEAPLERHPVTNDPSFWAVVEVMGHRRHVGLCTVLDLVGVKFIRIDVPGPVPGSFIGPPGGVFQYPGAALFGVHLSTEASVREECEQTVWRKQEPPQRRLAFSYGDEDDDYDSSSDYHDEDEN